MKSSRVFLFVSACAAIAALVVWLLSGESAESGYQPVSQLVEEAAPLRAAVASSEVPINAPIDLEIEFPPGAIAGEFVLHFQDQDSYLAYLAALRAAGFSPLGRIDALLAVRIPQEALLAVELGRKGTRADFSYAVERPPPPSQIDAAALASLRPFGKSARSIVGGVPHGDGTGVLVAILDSGMVAHRQFDEIDVAKLDLAGVGLGGTGAAHGTSVASIIAGKEGIAPNAGLFAIRVLDDEGRGNSFQVAEGIVRAVDAGAKVINLSLGVYQDSALLRQAVAYAAGQDVLLVAAAGNDAYPRMPYPAGYDEVIAVTALDAGDSQAIFPNQSMEIDFAAPGVGVLAAGEDDGEVLFSGTSAAAPFVTATLASLMSGPDALTPSAATELLRSYLNDLGAVGTDAVYGGGAIDWNRLRERSTPGILDVALGGIYLSPEAQPGTTMPVEVTVQNRGTKWFNEAQLEVLINDAEPVSFTIETLGPGQTTSRKVFAQIPSKGSETSLRMAARILIEDLNEDVRLENNLRAVEFRPR